MLSIVSPNGSKSNYVYLIKHQFNESIDRFSHVDNAKIPHSINKYLIIQALEIISINHENSLTFAQIRILIGHETHVLDSIEYLLPILLSFITDPEVFIKE